MVKTMKSEELAMQFGYLTVDEVHVIKKYVIYAARNAARRARIAKCVNIGAGAGTSGLAIAEAYPRTTRYTIDIRPGGPLGGLEGERNAFKRTGLTNPNQILGDSKLVGVDFKNKNTKIDFLFIDGDHEEEGARGDFDAWFDNVIYGGFILFHDYGSNDWPAVKGVADDVCESGKCKLVEVVGTIAVLERLYVEK